LAKRQSKRSLATEHARQECPGFSDEKNQQERSQFEISRTHGEEFLAFSNAEAMSAWRK
jgi:hypothetical protein